MTERKKPERGAAQPSASLRQKVSSLKDRTPTKDNIRKRFSLGPVLKFLAIVGPGIIIANAGNDAGGVYTYSDIGAKYGYSLLWTFIPITISLIVVQEMVGRLGCITGKGLMDLIRERFGVRWTLFVSIVVIIANGGTLLAEFAGVAGALGLLGIPKTIAIIGAALLIAVIVMRGNRQLVERIFLALGLAFFSYFITAFLVPTQWKTVGHAFLIPSLSHPGVTEGAFLIDVVALIGTTITPYMQLYLQSSIVDKGSSRGDLPYVRADIISGAAFSNIVSVFIVITTAATLFPHGLAGIGITSTGAAARALTPLVGIHAQQLFAVGLLGASLLAAAVLPLSTAFVVCEAFGAERSVQSKFSEAPLFFMLFLGLIIITAGVMLLPHVSITGVAIGTQTLDGILLPVLLVFIFILANDKSLLGRHRNSLLLNIISFITVIVLIGLDILLLLNSF